MYYTAWQIVMKLDINHNRFCSTLTTDVSAQLVDRQTGRQVGRHANTTPLTCSLLKSCTCARNR